MSKKNLSEMEKGGGYFLGLTSNLMDVVREKAYPFAAIYRLATPGGRTTLGKIVDFAYADWQAEQPASAKAMAGELKPIEQPEGGHPYRGEPQNGNAPFSAPIVYVQPEFEELKRRFPADVNPDYRGKRFDPIERCRAISKENREVAFEYVHLDRHASTDEVLAEIDRKGLRPALYEELLSFAEQYPDEQRKYPIVALGSEARVRGYCNVAFFDDDGRSLRLHWVGNDWSSRYRFLAVRKETPKAAEKEPEKFIAPVVYSQPCFDELYGRFNWINPDYHGHEFNAIGCCKDVSRENREVEFEYVHLGREAPIREVLAEIDRKGLRPALYEELLSFAEQYPDEQEKRCIVAVGSEMLLDSGRRHAYLWRDGFGRVLNLGFVNYVYHDRCWFLAVRKGTFNSAEKEPETIAVEEKLPPDHYRIRVTYAPLPSMDELGKEWGEENVTNTFHRWPVAPHPSCQDMDRTPGDRMFYLHDVGHDCDSEGWIAWGMRQCNAAAPNGYRPATCEETYEFAKAHPELVDFIGLGSIAMVAGNVRHIVGVRQYRGKRTFCHHLFDGVRRRGGNRILFVVK